VKGTALLIPAVHPVFRWCGSGDFAVQSVHQQTARPLKEHKVLIAMATLAVVYCLGAPFAADFIAHLGF
jgi:hypothetical protein